MKNLLLRSLSGIVFVSILLIGMLINKYLFFSVFAIVTCLAVYEFNKLLNSSLSKTIPIYLTVILSFVIFTVSFLVFGCDKPYSWMLVIPFLFIIVPFVELYRNRSKAILNVVASIFGIIYIAIPFSLLNILAFYQGVKFDATYIVAIFIFIWLNDSFAYLFGITLGRHRLFKRISPKKSWEGAVGGAAISLLVAYLYADYSSLGIGFWMGFAFVVVVSANLGDLVESMFKRSIGVKDSGNLIPGHGGMLDRFDSTLFAVPTIVLYLTILNIFNFSS